MRIGQGAHTYEWIDNWARIPATKSGRENGRTHGVVVTDVGTVLVFHQAKPAVLIFDRDGSLLGAWGDRFAGAHGMTLTKEDGAEYLWLTDQYSAEVVKTTLDGTTVMNLQCPELPLYKDGTYSPTWVAVNEEQHGGNGDIWVADGYGMGYVHRFDRTGRYLHSIHGMEGGPGAFQCPHGISVDIRKGKQELYVADRGNRRFQVYDLEGHFKRSFGADFLTSPCGCITHRDLLMIPELNARLAVLNDRDELVCYLGENEAVCTTAGWPDFRGEMLKAGKFNSPHAMAADGHGNLYVVEWIIGGRITKLAKI